MSNRMATGACPTHTHTPQPCRPSPSAPCTRPCTPAHQHAALQRDDRRRCPRPYTSSIARSIASARLTLALLSSYRPSLLALHRHVRIQPLALLDLYLPRATAHQLRRHRRSLVAHARPRPRLLLGRRCGTAPRRPYCVRQRIERTPCPCTTPEAASAARPVVHDDAPAIGCCEVVDVHPALDREELCRNQTSGKDELLSATYIVRNASKFIDHEWMDIDMADEVRQRYVPILCVSYFIILSPPSLFIPSPLSPFLSLLGYSPSPSTPSFRPSVFFLLVIIPPFLSFMSSLGVAHTRPPSFGAPPLLSLLFYLACPRSYYVLTPALSYPSRPCLPIPFSLHSAQACVAGYAVTRCAGKRGAGARGTRCGDTRAACHARCSLCGVCALSPSGGASDWVCPGVQTAHTALTFLYLFRPSLSVFPRHALIRLSLSSRSFLFLCPYSSIFPLPFLCFLLPPIQREMVVLHRRMWDGHLIFLMYQFEGRLEDNQNITSIPPAYPEAL
ncbi:hypothetical protein C8J57DRAFT_1715958 [Mycena rebaudengoi]|nr:hypothetical protein C8J57DRAFT_1715958 [Mycena rebaudengoi]